MSRLGKKPIKIPASVLVSLEEKKIKIKGPKGEGLLNFENDFKLEIKEDFLIIVPIQDKKDIAVKWGTLRSRIANLIKGAGEGFTKQLEIKGVGYLASVEGKNISLKIGYNHPVVIPIPEDLEVTVEKNLITVNGMCKEQVGQLAALIKSKKPVEPYKGKGIYYVGEKILRKAGKKVTGSTD